MSTLTSLARGFAVLLLAMLVSVASYAQTLVGTVEGTVTDEQGAVLPGATATLTGPRGSQTATSDEKGIYRFIGVEPGDYTLKLELGTTFKPLTREVNVKLGGTSTVDFTMSMASLTETVEVRGAAPTVDVKSSATDTSVSQNMLQMTPLYSSTATTLMNAAPGITSSSAYGGQAGIGNALMLDGVDTRDPEGGTAWTFFNQNLIEEIQIGGLGAPAEYGGFTGGIINTVTKSGGNMFSGLFSIRYTEKGLSSKNVDEEQLELNPNLGNAAVLKDLKDYTVQMGGPLKQNKAFFFASIQRYSALSDPIGPVENSEDISPRINLKFTLQPTARDTIILGTQYDQYNVTGRVGYWPSAQATDQQTVEEDAPEWVWNAQYRRTIGTKAFFEAKLTGYDGYYYLDPIDPSPFTYDADEDSYSGGGGGQYYADRSRNQFQASLTRYAEKFGSHSFKFGAEIERSHVRSQYQPYGPAGFYVLAYSGVPYYRVTYGYDLQGDNRRTSLYAQDQWTAGRATLNLGLRMDRIRGYSPVLDETVYTPKIAWGPRAGIAFNLTKDDTAAIKGYWGRLYEGTAATIFTAATPGIQDYTYTPVNAAGQPIGPPEVDTPGQTFDIDQDIKHPYTDEFNVSYEQQLVRGLRLTATGIWRRGTQFTNNVIADARWSPTTLTNPLTGQTFTAYNWANQSASNESFRVQNTDGFQYIGTNGQPVGTLDPRRNYKGLMLVLSNSLRGRLGYQLSYVLSKAEGNVDNSGTGAYFNGTGFTSPNTTLINAFGELTNSRRHEIKAYFTYRIPKVDVMLGGNYTGLSGRHYTPTRTFPSSALDVVIPARRAIFLEPRGTQENDFVHQVDLRVEKVFDVMAHRFGVYADTINLFNANGVTTRLATYPSSAGVQYGSPTGIQGARQITFGGRWSF